MRRVPPARDADAGAIDEVGYRRLGRSALVGDRPGEDPRVTIRDDALLAVLERQTTAIF
jgi:hypothetical protein